MKYIDKLGVKYITTKKNDNYYLLVQKRNFLTKELFYDVELKGKENILKFIKNNELKRCDD